ncbi:threonine-phosphate decarboxylase CobD [Magnetococcus sp. PR-3]|uniref:threonine-phosphate decarboxylase CobD n=1 Tax=Magnetococcus sp. PR-3 TaxID=3120355 RepID=UPI002FCDEFCD
MNALHHGGRLYQAAAEFDIPLTQWLDLSTGIHPQGWRPARSMPDSCWNRLPEEEDGLLSAAQHYYGTAHILPIAGSQAAIQTVPRLCGVGKVGILTPTYAEHAHAWRQAGHQVVEVKGDQVSALLPELNVLVVVNPNNPTGTYYSKQQLMAWLQQLSSHDGLLVVDEAFMDATPEASLLDQVGVPGLVVLRSLGKFFGLAGARVGFCMGPAPWLSRMAEWLGPWTLSHPARWVATGALKDENWQQRTRQELPKLSHRLMTGLTDAGLTPTGGTGLFQYVRHFQAKQIGYRLAQKGILVRGFESPSALRFGLPGEEAQWQRFQQALSAVMQDLQR